MATKYVAPAARRSSMGDAFPPLRLQWAVAEASRCLMCEDPPCQQGCLAGVDVKKFIRALKSRNLRGAVSAIRDRNFLVATCGRVCPQGELCEKRCSATGLAKPIAIGELQRFVGEMAIEDRIQTVFPEPRSLGAVAVVGAGPAGLAVAYYLRREGVVVDLYERRARLGGMPGRVLPRFRLPRAVLETELAFVAESGIPVRCEEVKDFGALAGRYKAVFLGCGLGVPRGLDVPGAKLVGVHQADGLLELANGAAEAPRWTGPTIVLGGGNTAIDASAVALRLGSSTVTIAYRRGEAEMPAWLEHRHFVLEEGVELVFLRVPVEILGADGHVAGVRLQVSQLGAPDASGRAQSIPVEGAFEELPCQQVVLALGNELANTRHRRRTEGTAGGSGDDADLEARNLCGRRPRQRRRHGRPGRGGWPTGGPGHPAAARPAVAPLRGVGDATSERGLRK
jgi:glutamate synthase (NADPH/NADH) small chain